MPSTPKFCNRNRYIWIIKILINRKSKKSANSNCNIRVTRKIKIYFQHKQECPDKICVSVNTCNRHGLYLCHSPSQSICNNYLFGISNDNSVNAVCNCSNICFSNLYLWLKMLPQYDRS